MPEHDHDEDVMLMERLSRTIPARPTVDSMKIAFESGRRIGARNARRWQAATGATLLLALTLAIWSPGGPTAVRSPSVPPNIAAVSPAPQDVFASGPDVSTGSQSSETVIALRDAVLTRGIDALPPRSVGGTRDVRTVGGLTIPGGAL